VRPSFTNRGSATSRVRWFFGCCPVEGAVYFAEGFGDGDASFEDVDVVSAESGEFCPAESSVCGDVDPCFVAVWVGVGELFDLVGVEEFVFSFVDVGEWGSFGWVGAEFAAADCCFEDHGEELVDLSDSGW
jgi:hypothetical protein